MGARSLWFVFFPHPNGTSCHILSICYGDETICLLSRTHKLLYNARLINCDAIPFFLADDGVLAVQAGGNRLRWFVVRQRLCIKVVIEWTRSKSRRESGLGRIHELMKFFQQSTLTQYMTEKCKQYFHLLVQNESEVCPNFCSTSIFTRIELA